MTLLDSTEQKIKKILYQELQIDDHTDTGLDLYELYNLNKMDMTGVILNIEESFQVPLLDADFYKSKSVKSMVSLIDMSTKLYS